MSEQPTPKRDDLASTLHEVQLAILNAVLAEIESIGTEGSGTTAGHSWGNVALASRSYFNLTQPE